MNEENLISDNIIFDNSEMSSLEPQAVYDYDYRTYLQTIINNQNSSFNKLNDLHNLINAGFTSTIWFLAIVFAYLIFKNFIRK